MVGKFVLFWCECNVDMCWLMLVFGNFVECVEMWVVFDSVVDDFIIGYFIVEELKV